MTRANLLYTRRTLSGPALESLMADIERNALENNLLSGLRGADLYLRHAVENAQRFAGTDADVVQAMTRIDVPVAVALRVLDFVDEQVTVAALRQTLAILIKQQSEVS